jgi:hypothetical protein
VCSPFARDDNRSRAAVLDLHQGLAGPSGMHYAAR